MRVRLLLVMAFGAAPVWGAASGWVENGPSRVRLISPYGVAAEGEVRLGVEMRLEEGWHSYWKNSGDAGYAPAVEVTGVEGVELLYPAPHRFDLPGGLVAFGYEDEVVYPLRGRLRAGGRDTVEIVAELDYVVCAEECIPYQARLALDQAVGSQAVEDAETAPVVERWWEQVPVAVEEVPGVETRGALVAGEAGAPALEIRVTGAAGERAEVFFEPHDVFEPGRPVARAAGEEVVFRVPLAARAAGEALPAKILFAWTVTGLSDEGRRLAIEARREVAGTIRRGATANAGDGGAAGPLPSGSALLAGATAVAATLLALYLWGILGPAPEGPARAGGPGRRQLAGFAALGGAVLALFALARMASRETPAAVELALLGLALCAWLRRRTAGRGIIPAALTVGLVACAGAALWLAHRGQL